MNSYFDKNFPGLKLEKPLFYSWPIGLRFEIGPDEISIWKDSKKSLLNENYFTTAHERAILIFEFIFSSGDEVEVIYQQYSDGRKKIRKSNFIFKQFNGVVPNQYKYSDIRDIYELEYKSECWKRINITSLSIGNINYKNILLSLINTDFGLRQPSIWGECYFINRTKNVILNLYDDRGMDVISSSRDSLVSLYKSHNDWLLNYDRNRMDYVFT